MVLNVNITQFKGGILRKVDTNLMVIKHDVVSLLSSREGLFVLYIGYWILDIRCIHCVLYSIRARPLCLCSINSHSVLLHLYADYSLLLSTFLYSSLSLWRTKLTF
jgi:hypothetical protein